MHGTTVKFIPDARCSHWYKLSVLVYNKVLWDGKQGFALQQRNRSFVSPPLRIDLEIFPTSDAHYTCSFPGMIAIGA